MPQHDVKTMAMVGGEVVTEKVTNREVINGEIIKDGDIVVDDWQVVGIESIASIDSPRKIVPLQDLLNQGHTLLNETRQYAAWLGCDEVLELGPVNTNFDASAGGYFRSQQGGSCDV